MNVTEAEAVSRQQDSHRPRLTQARIGVTGFHPEMWDADPSAAIASAPLRRAPRARLPEARKCQRGCLQIGRAIGAGCEVAWGNPFSPVWTAREVSESRRAACCRHKVRFAALAGYACTPK